MLFEERDEHHINILLLWWINIKKLIFLHQHIFMEKETHVLSPLFCLLILCLSKLVTHLKKFAAKIFVYSDDEQEDLIGIKFTITLVYSTTELPDVFYWRVKAKFLSCSFKAKFLYWCFWHCFLTKLANQFDRLLTKKSVFVHLHLWINRIVRGPKISRQISIFKFSSETAQFT